MTYAERMRTYELIKPDIIKRYAGQPEMIERELKRVAKMLKI